MVGGHKTVAQSCRGPQSSVVTQVQLPLKGGMELRPAEGVVGHKLVQIQVVQERKAQLEFIMSKVWYNRTTGDGAVFDDAEDMSNWPDFQADPVAATATQVRAKRDELLEASDHMALADRITDEWRDYRQTLRDLPAQEFFPETVNWPVAPS